MNENNFNEHSRYQSDLWELEHRYRSRTRLEYILRLYIATGIFVIILAIILFIVSTFDFNLNTVQLMSVILAGAGLLVSIFSWTILSFRKQVQSKRTERFRTITSLSEFLAAWTRFETFSREVIIESDSNFESKSIRDLIHKLLQTSKISEQDRFMLEKALQLRNLVVHEGYLMSVEESSEVIRYLTAIMDKLSHKGKK